MSLIRKDQICALLKGIESGDTAAVAVVNEDKYIQHNPQTHEGSEGLAALFERLSKTSPRVNIVRIFEDGNYVFAHTEYDFTNSNIGFEVFRFEDDFAVEHWDNIQKRQNPNPSDHTMVDGPTDAIDIDKTEYNREIVRSFVEEILLNGKFDKLKDYINDENFTEHNPRIGDGMSALHSALFYPTPNEGIKIQYDKMHRLLAEGNFVLSVSEGLLNGVHSSFYDLYRVAQDKIVEHWDTTEAIPSRNKWKNDNGKF
ncbi:MAG: putative SnoaL-like aldol condensation-catalyzing enzyme [Gammaproteobacteria bacterium]|jgi:predicted SnoaL-like aldol condensation-catalyzing enzyme